MPAQKRDAAPGSLKSGEREGNPSMGEEMKKTEKLTKT